MTTDIRPGEVAAPRDPATLPGDAHLVFIGHARTPWSDRSDCPKNLRQARERKDGAFQIEIDEDWRLGLRSLEPGGAIIVLTWMHRARRDLLVQAPQHGATTTVFALRSPVRPNPIGLHVVKLVACDADAGLLRVDALDCLDGTPVLDIKPYFGSVDVPPES